MLSFYDYHSMQRFSVFSLFYNKYFWYEVFGLLSEHTKRFYQVFGDEKDIFDTDLIITSDNLT